MLPLPRPFSPAAPIPIARRGSGNSDGGNSDAATVGEESYALDGYLSDTFDRHSFVPPNNIPPQAAPMPVPPQRRDAANQAGPVAEPAPAARAAVRREHRAPVVVSAADSMRQREEKRWEKKALRGFTEEYPRRISRPVPLVERTLTERTMRLLTSVWRGFLAFADHFTPRVQFGIGVNMFRFFE